DPGCSFLTREISATTARSGPLASSTNTCAAGSAGSAPPCPGRNSTCSACTRNFGRSSNARKLSRTKGCGDNRQTVSVPDASGFRAAASPFPPPAAATRGAFGRRPAGFLFVLFRAIPQTIAPAPRRQPLATQKAMGRRSLAFLGLPRLDPVVPRDPQAVGTPQESQRQKDRRGKPDGHLLILGDKARLWQEKENHQRNHRQHGHTQDVGHHHSAHVISGLAKIGKPATLAPRQNFVRPSLEQGPRVAARAPAPPGPKQHLAQWRSHMRSCI